MLVPGEKFIQSFKTIRDGVVFTTERIFTINIQGLTGKKKDFTSLPYSKIQAFSVETAGVFDADSELDLWFSGLGKVRFEFIASAKVPEICRIISERTLSGGKVVQQKVPADTRHEPLVEQRREMHVARPAKSSPVEPDPVYQRAEKQKRWSLYCHKLHKLPPPLCQRAKKKLFYPLEHFLRAYLHRRADCV